MVARLVQVAGAGHSDVIREQLQRNNLEQGREQLRSWRNLNYMVGRFASEMIAGGHDGDYDTVACAHFLDVGDTFFIARDGIGIVLVVSGETEYWQGLIE